LGSATFTVGVGLIGCGEGVQVGSPGKGVLDRVGWGSVAKAVGRVAFGLQPTRRRLNKRKKSRNCLSLGIQHLPKRCVKQTNWMDADFRGECGKHR